MLYRYLYPRRKISLSTSAGDASNPSSSVFFASTSNVGPERMTSVAPFASGEVDASARGDRRREDVRHARRAADSGSAACRSWRRTPRGCPSWSSGNRGRRRTAIGDGTYGVSRSNDQTTALVPSMLPARRATRIALQVVALEAAHQEHHAVVVAPATESDSSSGRRPPRRRRRSRGRSRGSRRMAGTMTCAPSVHLEDERRGPGVDFLARHAPQFLAVALVERDDERLCRSGDPRR